MGFEMYATVAVAKAPVSTFAEIFADAIKEAKNNAVVNGPRKDHATMSQNCTIFGVDIGHPYGSPDAICTCVDSILDCQAASHSNGDEQGRVIGTTQPASSNTTTKETLLHVQGRSDDPHQPQRKKFGDVPNPANQRKAARRRGNRELRLENPAVYREVMTAKKAVRDRKLRAEGQ
ncbi:mitochondrial acyl carrier protein [Pestalotiopsis sp. IQ-011]